MDLYMAIYGAVLFFLLSPRVLFRFPAKNHLLVLGVHAVLFAIIWQLTHKAVYQQIYGKEGFYDDNISPNTLLGIVLGVSLGAVLIIILYEVIQSATEDIVPLQSPP